MRHAERSLRLDDIDTHCFSPIENPVAPWRPSIALLAGASLLVASATLAVPIEKIAVNLPPETILSSGPPDSSATNYRVSFYWSGTDPDGTVDHFDFIMVDHPRSNDSIGPGGMDPVIITVPAPDDPRWTSTTLTDSLFVTSADTLRRDPRPGPGESPADVLLHPFERWHSFFVRAVDDEGLADPTPDYRSFNSKNIAPTVALQPPIMAGPFEFAGAPVIVFNWEGDDPVDEVTNIEPVASRYVIISTAVSLVGTGDRYVSFPESLYVLPSRHAWSPWVAWDAEDGSGKRAVISGLSRVGDGFVYYLFAVQAMDEAGAITPVFDYQTVGKNNCARVRVRKTVGPLLTVREDNLGIATFAGGSNTLKVDVAAGQPVRFHWSADASHYGGTIAAYRYGWNIRNPDNDEEWSVWSLDNTAAPTQVLSAGTHRFFLQARDDAEITIAATFELITHPMTMSRDLLWVDDSDPQTDAFTDSIEDVRWLSVLSQVAASGGLDFDPLLDVYDIQMDEFLRPPSLDQIFDHKVVVWNTRSGRDHSSGLRRSARFYDPIPERNQNTARNFNTLKAYVAGGGRLWVSGFKPAQWLWPDERARGAEGGPVNVTQWDDPIEPHPDIDSIGTSSLLYKMGIEMFDVGSSLESSRSRPQHFCYGLLAAVPDVPALQVSSMWSQAGTGGRTNTEIYNMPQALAAQFPPLEPSEDRTRVLYTYVSGLPEAEGVTYPQTADRQPMLVVTKTSLDDAHSSTAFCGFELHLLDADSHLELARHVLLREMGLGTTPVLLHDMTIVFSGDAVHIRWEMNDSSDPAEFLLRARAGDMEWTVPFAASGPGAFAATDASPYLGSGADVTYSLFARVAGSSWMQLAHETISLAEAPPKLQLLSPHPNPFNPRVAIPFVLPAAQHVWINIFAADGRKIATLVDEDRPAGTGSVLWEGKDEAGRAAASGLYWARLLSGGVQLSRKLVLLR